VHACMGARASGSRKVPGGFQAGTWTWLAWAAGWLGKYHPCFPLSGGARVHAGSGWRARLVGSAQGGALPLSNTTLQNSTHASPPKQRLMLLVVYEVRRFKGV
jgi:hypothetical protein